MSHVARDTMNQDEVTIIGGALTFRDMKVCDVMTLEKNIFMIPINETLSYNVCFLHISDFFCFALLTPFCCALDGV